MCITSFINAHKKVVFVDRENLAVDKLAKFCFYQNFATFH